MAFCNLSKLKTGISAASFPLPMYSPVGSTSQPCGDLGQGIGLFGIVTAEEEPTVGLSFACACKIKIDTGCFELEGNIHVAGLFVDAYKAEAPLEIFFVRVHGHVAASLDESAPYYAKEKSGWNWIIEKPVDVLQLGLQETGKDVNEADNEGDTLLHKVAAIDCNYSQDTAKALYKKAKLLLEKGADVSLTNNKDETAMDLAMKDNLKGKLAELLLHAKK
ncbi:MAG: hypothetical protein QM664_05550 [Flavihumibacter sp.]